MLASPILICRTKYVDYPNPVFCSPSNVDDEVLRNLHNDIIKGNNLKVIEKRENKVFISTTQWIIIGKVTEICQLEKSLDTSLDKEEGGAIRVGICRCRNFKKRLRCRKRFP